jgi:hypothetical protein
MINSVSGLAPSSRSTRAASQKGVAERLTTTRSPTLPVESRPRLNTCSFDHIPPPPGPLCPVGWLDAAGITEGALFRQTLKGGQRVGAPISGQAYYDVVKQGIAAIGLDTSKFGSHSMRSGWISTAARNGASVWKMKEISRHKSTGVLAGYVPDAELFQQHASAGMY